MSGNGNCSTCGTPVRPGLNGGVCQGCMLKAGLRSCEQEIREEARQIESPSERAAYVQEVCSDDPVLRDGIRAWLEQLGTGEGESFQHRSIHQEPDDRVIGERYRLLHPIGEGGFGTVYLADQIAPVRRRVAVKILKLGMDTRQVVARFELERQALAMMDHPNIAKVFDAGATEIGRPYFVMEWVRGVPITQFCHEQHLLTRRRLELFVEVCHAVQHAHQKGIIHRDLKPSNILVALKEGVPVPKVIDFGIAKATQQELTDQTVLTQLHQFLGTPAYISPEQAALTNPDIDTRSDIYSLGVLLYELLTGSTPFNTKQLVRSDLDDVRRVIRETEPDRPSTRLARQGSGKSAIGNRQSGIHRDLDWIVMKCLQKDRTRRYATANGLAMDIQRHLTGEPIVARPPSTFYRLSKLLRRNPVVASLTVLLFLALAAAIIAGATMSVRIARAKRESDRANRQLSETVRYLESQKLEALATEGRRSRPLSWLASLLRRDPMDAVAASRALSMLTLHNFALPLGNPILHDGQVNSARLSPDGTQIMTASDDGTVRFWDASDGRLSGVIAYGGGVGHAAYLARGKRMIVVTQDKVAKVYDTASGKLLFDTPGLRHPRDWGVETGDGQWLLISHQDGTLSRWDLQSGVRLELPITFSSAIGAMAHSEKGGCFAVACQDGTVHLLDLSSGQPLRLAKQFDAPVELLRFTPDGRRLFLCLDDGRRLVIWPYQDSDEFREFIPPAPIQMNILLFTPDGRRLLTSSWAAPLQIWDAESLEPAAKPVATGVQGRADYCISGDGSCVASFTQNGIAQILEIETGQTLFEALEHQGWIRDLTFSASATQLLTASQDGTARLWDLRMRKPPQLLLPRTTGGGEASFNHAGTRLVVSAHRDAVQVCDAQTGQAIGPLLRHPGEGGRAHIRRASFAPDDSRILTAGEDGFVRVWDAESFELRLELAVGGVVVVARFSTDGRFVVAGNAGGLVSIWSADSGERVGGPMRHGEEVIALDIAPGGGAFVTASAQGTARCWTLPSGQPAAPPMRHRGIVWNAVYSPDGQRIVTASADRTAQIWDSRTGQALLKPFRHEKDVLSAAFSPDGKCVLTTSEDGSARVWDAVTGDPQSPWLRHSAKVWMGSFSPDSRFVATGADDQTVRLWDARSGLPIAEPLPHSGYVGRLAFSPDGKRLLTFGGQPELWDVVIAPTPVPEWFCDLIEAVAGSQRVADGQILPASPAASITTLRERVAAGPPTDFFSRWAKWFLIDRMQDAPPRFQPF